MRWVVTVALEDKAMPYEIKEKEIAEKEKKMKNDEERGEKVKKEIEGGEKGA